MTQVAEHYFGVPLLGQENAYQLDQDLMTVPGFSVDQLMELAGLSVAAAILDAYATAKRVLVVAGPGNNGIHLMKICFLMIWDSRG